MITLSKNDNSERHHCGADASALPRALPCLGGAFAELLPVRAGEVAEMGISAGKGYAFDRLAPPKCVARPDQPCAAVIGLKGQADLGPEDPPRHSVAQTETLKQSVGAKRRQRVRVDGLPDLPRRFATAPGRPRCPSRLSVRCNFPARRLETP